MAVLDTLTAPSPLITGDTMTREEFIRRWEQLPDLKKAELIEGVVYVPSPLTSAHGATNRHLGTWLVYYQSRTPGCGCLNNATTYMFESAPQPDLTLFIATESRLSEKFFPGARELIVEICHTSTDYDFGVKQWLYLRAGVAEYITAETINRRIIWRRLVNGMYHPLEPDADGLLKSGVFPGLWLDADGLWASDMQRLLAAVDAGTSTPEQREFVARLRQS